MPGSGDQGGDCDCDRYPTAIAMAVAAATSGQQTLILTVANNKR
jgi:hypothetical protein